VKVFEHQDDRMARGLADQPVVPRPPHLIAHHRRIAARRRDRRMLGRDPAQLAEERGDPRAIAVGDDGGEPRRELVAARADRLAVDDSGGASEQPAGERVRRSDLQRIAARVQPLERRPARSQPRQQLGPQPALAETGRRLDQHRARARLGHHFVEQPEQRGQLAIAPDTRRRLAEHARLARGIGVLVEDP
jgi:hypothetical protein